MNCTEVLSTSFHCHPGSESALTLHHYCIQSSDRCPVLAQFLIHIVTLHGSKMAWYMFELHYYYMLLLHITFVVSPLCFLMLFCTIAICPLNIVLLSFLTDFFFPLYLIWIARSHVLFQLVPSLTFHSYSGHGFEFISASGFSCTNPEKKA